MNWLAGCRQFHFWRCKTESRVIDCDVHPYMDSLGAIFPYIDDNWRKRLEPYRSIYSTKSHDSNGGRPAQSGLQSARGSMPFPARKDAVPPSGGLPGSDLGFLVEHYLNRHPVDIAILLPTQPLGVGSFTNADEAAMVAAGYNDCFIDQWLPKDPRFRLAIVVSPHDPLLAAKEIRRKAETPGVVGVMMPLPNILMGNRHYFPIYEAAQEYGLPIILHPNGQEGDFVGNTLFAGGIPVSFMEKYSLYSEIAMSQIVSLIFQGVFETFPKLKVALMEYGWTWLPSLLWRMDATWKAGRRTVPWVRRSPSDYFFDHIRLSSEPALEVPNQAFLEHVLDMMNASRTLMFSSDYPHWDADEPEFVFRQIPTELKRRIFRENAIELFGERLQLPVGVA